MTSPCTRIQAEAAGLMSLAADDPERRAAEVHAVTCVACAAMLAEAGAVMKLLDQVPPLRAPRAGAMARVHAEILASIAREPAGKPSVRVPPDARVLGTLAAVLAGVWLLPMLKHLGDGAPVAVSALLAVAAIAIGVAALRRGGAWWTLPGLAAFAFVATGRGPGGLQAVHGLECGLFEFALALVPLGIALRFVRRGRLRVPAGAAAAGTGALVAQAALHVACHAQPGTSHALVFHAGPVLVALAAGAAAGGWVGGRVRAS